MSRLILCVLALLAAGCGGIFEGQRGRLANPLRHITQAPGVLHHLPVLQQHPAPLGPAMDAYPVVEPPVVKRVWIVAHDNHHGDRISGHYVDVLYHAPRFAPLPGGTAQLPVAPRVAPLELVPEQPPRHSLVVPRASTAAQAGAATALPSLVPPGAGVSPALMQRLHQIRQRMRKRVQPPPSVVPRQGNAP